ncbi:hypothetical protein AB1Y20_010193 [Prymnesium parvum]|uniref:Uncharacterized protein n=1 Tax=Prymnesium parvum TaxID=97485 RepID=A0AB34K3Q5_PRYPA
MSYNTVGLAKALGEARMLKGHKQEGEKLRELLDKPNFCNELGKIGRDGTSGWSSMLEAALKGLNDERRANLLEHVEPLRKLIDTASKWEVQFECQMVVTFIEGAVERVLSSPFSAVSGLCWSMLNSLCGNDTYFRLMGYEKASTLAATLISCSWDALLPGSRNGAPSDPAGARLGAAESQQQAVFAARLLCAVMLNFHFTLPIEALLATIKKFVELLGAEGNDARLPQLWMAINTMLRRQAMEHGQVVWDDFITSRPLLEFVADALRSFSLVCDGGIVLRRLPLVPLASSGTLCGPHSDRPASLKAARARVRTSCESGCFLEQGRVPSTTACAAARDILSAGGAACCFGDATNAAGGRTLPPHLTSTPSGRCALFLGVVAHALHAGDASTCEWSAELIVRSVAGATSPSVLSDASLSLRPSIHALSQHAYRVSVCRLVMPQTGRKLSLHFVR